MRIASKESHFEFIELKTGIPSDGFDQFKNSKDD